MICIKFITDENYGKNFFFVTIFKTAVFIVKTWKQKMCNTISFLILAQINLVFLPMSLIVVLIF